MPELPDLLHIQAKLEEGLRGRRVTAERLTSPVILRCLVRGNLSLLLGRPLEEIRRRSHFLVFRFEGLDLAVNPMLAGRFRVASPGDKDEGSLAFGLGNAYADEVLFAAGIHPKTWCRSLSHDDAVRLHDAIVEVMSHAVAEVAR